MGDIRKTFEKIVQNGLNIELKSARRVLFLYEEKINYIGDCCIRFDKLKHFREFVPGAVIDMNFAIQGNYKYYHGLLKNNPYIDNVTTLEWEKIDLAGYDVIFCITHKETKLLKYLHLNYGNSIIGGQFSPAIFSISEMILKQAPGFDYIFPVHERLKNHVIVPSPVELYIDRSEQEWGDNWLISKGILEDEELYILCDSASERHKLLNITVYFKILEFILSRKKARVLVFDERKIGKHDFYKGWLGEKQFSKIIFSEGLSLREDLCIIGSGYTKMVFGPCTGLMHCSSSIYNNYVKRGMSKSKAPLMVTYTGQYFGDNKNAHYWWSNCPLVDCLLLKGCDGKKELALLADMTQEEASSVSPLPCEEYTSDLLIGFIEKRIDGKIFDR
jgi:hypothetical protein